MSKHGEEEEERKMVFIKKAKALCGDYSKAKTNATAQNIKALKKTQVLRQKAQVFFLLLPRYS